MPHYGMLLDTRTCIGCLACTLACKVEHNNPPGVFSAPVIAEEIGSYPDVHRVYLPLMCMHCDDAPCIAACPTGAVRKREDGIVVVDKDLCCGSGACVVACPHGAMQLPKRRSYYFDAPTPFEAAKGDYFPPGTAVKCDLCAPRLDEGLLPACVEACPTESRVFGRIDEPEDPLSRRLLSQETATLQTGAFSRPAVRYTVDGLRDAGVGPEHLRLPYRVQTVWGGYHATEFTLLGAGAGLAVVHALMGGAGALPLALVALAAILVALGGLTLVLDLGRPLRFLQALRNQRGSWISRGALGDFLFLLIAAALAASPGAQGQTALSWLLALVGLLVMPYPALAMASLKAVPSWRGASLPLMFAVDGISLGAGLALLGLLLARGGAPNATTSYLAVGVCTGAVLRGILLHVHRRGLSRPSAAQPGVQGVLTGAPWRVGMLLGALAAALFAVPAMLLGGVPAEAAAALATAATLAGSFAGKLFVLRTGAKPTLVDPELEARAV